MKPNLFDIVGETSRGEYPFHMPGHKRNAAFLPADLLACDTTELPRTDNLHCPKDSILRLQENAAQIYGADESYFLVNGSSCGIIAAICSVCSDGDKILVARNSHSCVYKGLALSGASPVYISPEYFTDGTAGGVSINEIDDSFKAVVITSPTYEGYVSDVASITRAARSSGALLIVDEAHGAHFPFHGYFPVQASRLGADVVVNSLHKTLPALSQAALLHVNGGLADRERLRYYLNALQTTSPSYMIMASTDYSLRNLQARPELFDEYAARLTKVRAGLPRPPDEKAIRLSPERNGECAVFATDPGKLFFEVNTDVDGLEIAERLASRFRLRMEAASEKHFLAMTSVTDTDGGFGRLLEAVSVLNAELPFILNERKYFRAPPPEVVLTPREALRYETEAVDCKKAEGRVAGEIIMKYPPGIPLAAPGERLTREILSAVMNGGLIKNDTVKILKSDGGFL